MDKNKKSKDFLHHPVYAGGPKALTAFIYQHLQYPTAALAANVEGTVLVEYDIDFRGQVVATRVLQGIGHGCDEEACRVVSMLKFTVAKNRGLRVLFHQKARIVFKKPEVPAAAPVPAFQYVVTVTAPNLTPADPDAAEPPTTPTFTYTITFS